MPRLVVGEIDLVSMLQEVNNSFKVTNSLVLLQFMFKWNGPHNGC